MRDGVSAKARGIGRSLGSLRRQSSGFARSQAATGAMVGSQIRNLALLGAGYIGVGVGIGGSIRNAMKFETAMADVAKKSTLSARELGVMERRITELSNSMPLARTEIATLVAQAAQFGIANKDLEEFALLGAKAAVAFDMMPEDTANSLSQLKNAFGLDMAQLRGLADTINYTADSAGTSEQKVIDFLIRTAATGKTFGVTADQLAAFGASLNEIGIESSKAGTGMNAMMTKMGTISKNKKAREALDKVGGKGYSLKLQKKFYDTPVEAMKDLFKMAKKMDAESRAGLFLDMFGLEYGDDAAAITENIDTIVGRLDKLSDAKNAAGSVNKTFELFANTTEQKLKVLGNNISNIGAMFGSKLLPPIVAFSDKIVNTLATLSDRTTLFDKIGAGMDGFAAGLGFDDAAAGVDALNSGLKSLHDFVFGKDVPDTGDIWISEMFRREKQTSLSAIAADFQTFGDTLKNFGEAAGEFTAKAERFIGLKPGSVAESLGQLGGYGLTLTASALGVSIMASALMKLGRGLAFITGVSAAFSILKGGLRVLQALGGGAAVAGGGVATGGAGKGAARGGPFAGLAKYGWLLRWAGAAGAGAWLGSKAGEGADALGGVIGGKYYTPEDQAAVDNMKSELDAVYAKIQQIRETSKLPEHAENLVRPLQQKAAQLEDQIRSFNELSVRPNIDSSSLDSFNLKLSKAAQGMRSLPGVTVRGPQSGIAGARASGGPIYRGSTYLTGERGPELITANKNGYVHNAANTAKMAGGGAVVNMGGVTIAIYQQPGESAEALAERINQKLGEMQADALAGGQFDQEWSVA
ncbi:phage tail tape measure protein [Ahrensia marina]|uniref:Phage tail tape measure protein domain-containing protein n=1 Tax=Ahrensia marina TaxID=1514904 RepID=A0A0M9GN37_9HYPH|nr:phage tail tape measure protein [Ahrensia marina]KPB01369.1 hypothetical protein SU32_08965 [Ahrensia marina]